MLQIRTMRSAALGTLFLLGACSSTSLVDMWKDPANPKQPLQNVLVVTLQKTSATRRIWEDGFVAALRAHGVRATPSYQLFPNAAPDTAQLSSTVAAQGFDGVLVAHRTAVDTEMHFIRGYRSSIVYPGISPWNAHYFYYYQELYAPSYIETDRVVRYETDVWMTGGGGHLVWSGATASLNPTSAHDVNGEIADQIVPELIRQGVIGRK